MVVMPQELEVWYLLPAIRRELAKELMKLGMKQTDVAKKLEMTRATISQYVKSKRAKEIIFDKNTQAEIKKSAKLIFEKDPCLIEQMQRISKVAKQNRILCKMHKVHGHHDNNHACCGVCLK
ncbi:MAG: helix-turn-helix domain-containing protein [Candidatus Woesearchaeota archaeon]|jgi:hypothetical protein